MGHGPWSMGHGMVDGNQGPGSVTRRARPLCFNAVPRARGGYSCARSREEVMMDRREFLQTSAVLAGSALAARVPNAQSPPMVGIQIGAVSFQDEGTERVLDA